MTLFPIPTIYLDTNVCRDCIKNRSKKAKDSIHLLGIIKDRKWKCITSTFTFMELYDIEKDELFFNKKLRLGWEVNKILRERRHKDLSDSDLEEVQERIAGFYDEHNFIKFHQIDGEHGWEIADIISRNTNLSAADSIHLAVAWGSACDLLVTSDQDFIDEATRFFQESDFSEYLRICKPIETVKVVEELMKTKLRKTILKETGGHIDPSENLRNIEGIGPVVLNRLINADIFSISELVQVNPTELMKKLDFGNPESAKRIIDAAKLAQKNQGKAGTN